MCASVTPSDLQESRLPEDWQARLEQAGLRRTQATRSVLRLFLHDPSWNPSHAEVATALAQHGVHVNRVTLYRLLDRLAACGLLARQADADTRTWRFHLEDSHDDPLTPRFECDACHRQFRVAEASQSTREAASQLLNTLAQLGHQGQRVDLAIHGTCAVCVDRS